MAAIAVVLQPEPRPNGLVSVLRPLPDGWERGVDLMVRSTPEPVRIGPCATGSDEPEFSGTPEVFQPVIVRQGVICSLLGRPDTESVGRAAAEVAAGFALSQELYDGAGTSNPNLVADATDVGTALTVQDAIALLEDAAEQGLHGGLAVIHVPVGLSAYLDDIVSLVNGQLRTVAGNLVAVHGTGETIYATGEVWGAIGPADARRYDNVRVNTSEAWADIAAIAVFDSSTVWSSEVDAGS
jgi:hypothetical protein